MDNLFGTKPLKSLLHTRVLTKKQKAVWKVKKTASRKFFKALKSQEQIKINIVVARYNNTLPGYLVLKQLLKKLIHS